MTILTDGVHLVSTESEADLHRFAKQIGLKREWYQAHVRHPHYDMTVRWRVTKAMRAGAEQVTTAELLRRAWWAYEPVRSSILAAATSDQDGSAAANAAENAADSGWRTAAGKIAAITLTLVLALIIMLAAWAMVVTDAHRADPPAATVICAWQ